MLLPWKLLDSCLFFWPESELAPRWARTETQRSKVSDILVNTTFRGAENGWGRGAVWRSRWLDGLGQGKGVGEGEPEWEPGVLY